MNVVSSRGSPLRSSLVPRLTPSTQAELQQRRSQAVADLGARLRRPAQRELREAAGVPDVAVAAALHKSLVRQLWS